MNYSEIFVPVVTLITAQITVLDLARFRFGWKKLMLILGIEFIAQVSINVPILLFAGLELYGKAYFFAMDLPAFLTFWYISKRRDFRDLYTVLITIFISFCISVPAMGISQYIGKGYTWYNGLRLLIFAIIFVLIHFVIRKHYIRMQDELDKGWLIFCILPCIGSGLLYYQFWIYSKNGNFLSIVMDCWFIIIIMATVFLVFIYIFNQLHEMLMVREQKKLLDLQNKAQLEQFLQQKEATEKSNRRWHDMRHHTHELIELLEAGKTEDALNYLKEQRGIDVMPKEEYCLHPAVNSILCLWAERSRKAGIQVEIQTDIPDKLEIEAMELSALFANAFENAYEGCLRLVDNIQKSIKVEAVYNGKRLAIGFKNTCVENIQFEDGIPVSSKKGGGIGTRSIVYTVKRFRGAAFYEAKDGYFHARFILNI